MAHYLTDLASNPKPLDEMRAGETVKPDPRPCFLCGKPGDAGGVTHGWCMKCFLKSKYGSVAERWGVKVPPTEKGGVVAQEPPVEPPADLFGYYNGTPEGYLGRFLNLHTLALREDRGALKEHGLPSYYPDDKDAEG